ncbi:MAG: hypothetical protein KIT16_11685 [Rhodospirillaceae bacterium]|nr:hypothetical protein [Rhodospirillaceae bacterium]
MPRADLERLLGVRSFGAEALDDRLGLYRRQLCRIDTEPGEAVELAVWSRIDRRPMPPLPARAEYCDVGCFAAGREPNLYRYEQRRIGTALCVIRRARPDRDIVTGPITACSLGGARRVMLSIARKKGLPPAPMATVKALLDRAAATLR